MAKPLPDSLISIAISKMLGSPGSPYLLMNAVIHVGEEDIEATKVSRLTIETDYVNSFSDSILIYCHYPKGVLTNKIAPFKEDMTMSIIIGGMRENGSTIANDDYKEGTFGEDNERLDKLYKHGIVVEKTFRCYIDDKLDGVINVNDSTSATNPNEADLTDIVVVAFRLEEICVEQMRLLRTGLANTRFTRPMDLVKTLMVRHYQSLELDEDEKILGITVEDGHNPTPSWSLQVPDGLHLTDLPDHVQNVAGLYNDDLGFYIFDRHVYLWPLLSLTRHENTDKLLRIYLSPDPMVGIIEYTWRIPQDDPDVLEIFVAGDIDYKDGSVAKLHELGTHVNNIDSERLFSGSVVQKDNIASIKGDGVSGNYYKNDLISGREVYTNPRVTTNPYKISSELAITNGTYVTVMWRHSLPFSIYPSMAVELIYDYHGDIISLDATVLFAFSLVENEGESYVSRISSCNTVINLFVERRDNVLEKWIEEGSKGKSNVPEVNDM